MKKIFLLALTLISLQATANQVVGIHGILVSFRSMYGLQRVLNGSCMDVYLFRYESRKRYVWDHAYRLKEYLKCLAQNRPGEPIDFVAHSIGSWVLRAALNFPDTPYEATIGRAVLLAPPNRGASLGWKFRNFFPVQFALGDKSGWELMHYTEEDIICNYGNFPPCMEILVIAGCKGIHPYFDGCPNDTYVSVEETRLNTPHTHRTLPLTHGEVLTNKYSLLLTREFLQCGPR